jgi:hypothetical protein
MIKMVNLLKKDHKNTFGLGTSQQYDEMLTEVTNLQQYLISFKENVIGKDVDISNGHCAKIKEAKQKVLDTLIKVNEYIVYKNNKPRDKEAWMDIKGPHKVSRTEKRYKDAVRIRKLLNEQLESFEKLDEKLDGSGAVHAVCPVMRGDGQRGRGSRLSSSRHAKAGYPDGNGQSPGQRGRDQGSSLDFVQGCGHDGRRERSR